MAAHSFADAHVHTAFSTGDCQSPMAGYLQLFKQGEVPGIGFAEHYHPNYEYHPELATEPPFDHAGYCAAVEQAKAAGYPVYRGIEVSYVPDADVNAHCTKTLNHYRYDYAIGSVHFLKGTSFSLPDFHLVVPEKERRRDLLAGYYTCLDHVAGDDRFTVLGHADVFKRDVPMGHEMMEQCRDIIHDGTALAAKTAAQSGIIVEVNTSGLKKRRAEMMPSEEFLRIYRRYGGENICFSSDAHHPSNVCAGFDAARQYALSLGFTAIRYPWQPNTAVQL